MNTGHFYFGKNRTFLNWFDTHAPEAVKKGGIMVQYSQFLKGAIKRAESTAYAVRIQEVAG